MKILDKEYEEVSATEYLNTPIEKNRIQIINNNKVTFFLEVKPAPKFPIKIELSQGFHLNVEDYLGEGRFIDLIENDEESLAFVGGDKKEREQDINGILKALLYLETEDDIIKRLKELR